MPELLDSTLFWGVYYLTGFFYCFKGFLHILQLIDSVKSIVDLDVQQINAKKEVK